MSSWIFPFSKDIVTRASKEGRFAATKGKTRRYRNTPIKSTPVYTVPHSSLSYSNTLAVAWDEKAETYLNQLARRVRDEEGRICYLC